MNKFMWMIVGGIAGAIGGILLTPRSGEETRNIVAEQADKIAKDAQDLGNQAVNTIQEGLKQATDKGSEVVNKVQEAAGKGAEAAVDKNEELRAKIDAARERIAAQVKENATDAANAVKEEIPVAAKEAEKAVDTAEKKVEAVTK